LFNHREHKGFLGWGFDNNFLAGLRVYLPDVREPACGRQENKSGSVD